MKMSARTSTDTEYRLELFYEDGSPVPADQIPLVDMGVSGTVGHIHTRGPCIRCGGAGGAEHWPGFTCYRCGGQHSQRFERITTKVWTAEGLERLYAARERAERKRQEEAEKAAQKRHMAFEAWLKGEGVDTDVVDALFAYDGRSSFLQDLQFALEHETPLTTKQIDAARSALAQEQERKAIAARSEHLGEVGDRLRDLEVRVLMVRDLEGHYGPSRLVKMAHEGNTLVTFSTSAWVWDVDQGDTLVIDGTVKEHDAYEGEAQTVLTRTKRKS